MVLQFLLYSAVHNKHTHNDNTIHGCQTSCHDVSQGSHTAQKPFTTLHVSAIKKQTKMKPMRPSIAKKMSSKSLALDQITRAVQTTKPMRLILAAVCELSTSASDAQTAYPFLEGLNHKIFEKG